MSKLRLNGHFECRQERKCCDHKRIYSDRAQREGARRKAKKPVDSDMQIGYLAQRIDAVSDSGDTATLESLDAECAGLLGHEGPPDAFLYYFRLNTHEGLPSALPPKDW
ncbi:hypothetical protein MHM97_11615 [Epibacterium sp. Ofav1-8]|nr:hypothetical protein [Epibacterium sp. Ofav1-8]